LNFQQKIGKEKQIICGGFLKVYVTKILAELQTISTIDNSERSGLQFQENSWWAQLTFL